MTTVICEYTLEHIKNCEYCRGKIASIFTSHAGSATSEKKASSSRENGKKGGRPRKKVVHHFEYKVEDK